MKSWGGSIRLAVLIAGACALTLTAHAADFIQAYGWQTVESIVNSSTGASPASLALANCSHGTAACKTGDADISFVTDGLGFGGSPFTGGGTIANWLTSNITAGLTVDNLLVDTTAQTGNMDATIWDFTGTASFTHGQTFNIAHDDGVTIIVNGVHVLDAAGPTSPVTSPFTYNGPTGNFGFEIVYAECCGGPAVLSTNLVGPLNGTTPEPMTFVLVGTGLAGLGLLRRKRTV